MIAHEYIKVPRLRKIFKEEFCRLCGLCGERVSPSFCMFAYFNRPVFFIKVIKYLIYLQLKDKAKYSRFKTFPGFVGLFCNTLCAWGDKNGGQDICLDVHQRARCYAEFIAQGGLILNIGDIKNICKAWNKVHPREIGKHFEMPTDFVPSFKKKKSKKISKELNRIHKRMRSEQEKVQTALTCGWSNTKIVNGVEVTTSRLKPKGAPKKEVSTTFFHNENKEWEAKINEYLNNDTNNKKQIKTSKHNA